MQEKSSEQALSALEHSKKPVIDLFDDIAQILNLSWQNINSTIGSARNSLNESNNARFREQWVLRWLIKRLTQAVGQQSQQSKKQSQKQHSNHGAAEFLQDSRTWDLLSYLLAVIPTRIAQEILVERSLCRILNSVIEVILQRQEADTSTVQHSTSSVSSDDESGRPIKKRKLSNDGEVNGMFGTSKPFLILVHQLLQVAAQCATIFNASQDRVQLYSTSATRAWVDSLDGATALLGGIIRMASISLREAGVTHLHADLSLSAALTTVNQWLHLWYVYCSSEPSTAKQDSHKIFNNLVLTPALDLLQMKTKGHNEAAFKTLERQIAIHAILPARTIFQKQFSATWTSRKNSLQEAGIQRLVSEIGKILGAAAAELSNPTGGARASLLLTVASRLIPRSDVVKRKAEATWLEALFLCLVHLTQTPPSDGSEPNEMPYEDVPKLSVTEVSHLVELVNAFMTVDIVPSPPVWNYFAQNFVLAEGTDAPYTILAKVVKLNASVFTSDYDATKASLTKAIDARIADGVPHDKVELMVIVHGILSPILQEFGKSRQLTGFTTFWETKLADTFHDRMSAAPTTWDGSRFYVWDDPDLLKTFVATSHQYAAPSFCRDMLDQAQEEIEGLPSIVGPTHRAFARITIAIQVLKSTKRSSAMMVTMPQRLQPVVDALCLALGRTTDYQGHRWRLWSLLDTVVQLDCGVDWMTPLQKCEVILPFPLHSDADAESVGINTRRATLMERLGCVETIATSFELRQPGIESFLHKAIDMTAKLTEKYVARPSRSLQAICWDGTIESMDSLCVFLSSCFARLAAMPSSWVKESKASHNLLVALCTLLLTEELTSPSRALSISTSAEALLSTILVSTDVDLLGIFVEVMAKEEDTDRLRRIPILLHDLLLHHTDEKRTQEVVDFLLHKVEQTGPLIGNSCITDCLALVSDVSTRWPLCVEPKKSFNFCADRLQRSSVTADLIAITLTTQRIEKLVQALFALPVSSDGVTQWEKSIRAVLKRVKKELKDRLLPEEQELLDTYGGFLLLATVRQLQNLQCKVDNSEIVEMSSKVGKRFREVAFKSATHYLDGGSSVISIFKTAQLLDALVCTTDKNSYLEDRSEELRTLYRGLVEKILKVSSSAMLPLETSVLKSVKEMLDRLVSLHQIVSGLQIPIAVLAGNVSQMMSHGCLEIQASMALGPACLSRTTAHAPVVILVATGNEESFKNNGISDDTRLLFAVTAIAKNLTSDALSTSPELIQAFSQIASLQSALHSWTPTGLLFRLELSKLILEKHPNIINQHTIDTTLSSITLLTSSSCELTLNLTDNPHNPHPHHIFERLCTILTTLLIRYRRRLTGRHHLLLPALQSLLKCLFYPPSRQHLSTNPATSASKAAFLASLPHWLNPPTHTSPHVLPSTSATKFSRVLQTLCDPSASSARRATKRQHHSSSDNKGLNLIDETRLLRRQVSQHTQYLLQMYCQAMLDGYISHEVKEKLMPGLYAVCNAMDVEVMRGMNSAMNESQRAVWKDLYGEWRRWGRWNQR